MSWMKRPQAGEGANAGPQPYAAPQSQPYTNQQSMYPNYPAGAQQQPQQQYWAGGGAPYNQQYTQYQQEYPPNANHYQQQYNHNYTTNQGYNPPQQNYQQSYYQNQPQQNYPQTQPANSDGWEDNWDWGWDESTKQAQAQKAQSAAPPTQPEVYNNANVLEDSFAPTNNSNSTWNWGVDEKKEEPVLPPLRVSEEPATLPLETVENDMSPEPSNIQNLSNGAPPPVDEVRTLGDRDVVKERMPNLALGKRFHLDNLTPQWSIESQMSQESSDGPQTHSESTYRSENQSRNSNSPGPNTDNSNFNYSQSGHDDYTQNSELSKRSDKATLGESSRRESHEELARTMQDMTLVNRENLTTDFHENLEVERRGSQHSLPPPQASHAPPAGGLPPPSVASPRPPSAGVASPAPVQAPLMPPPIMPPASQAPAMPPPSQVPVMPPPSQAQSMPPPSSQAPILPPPVQAPSMPAMQSPSMPTPQQAMPPPQQAMPPPQQAMPPPQQAMPPSQQAMPPPQQAMPPPQQAMPPPQQAMLPPQQAMPPPQAPMPSLPPPNFPPPTNAQNPFKHSGPYGHKPSPYSGLSSPGMVSKAPSREPVGFEANLETTPDNSERPDAPPAGAAHPTPAAPPPDNMEVAPRTERNEYLQTAHLSGGDYENAQYAPPAGVRRVPVGRGEEPPVGRGDPLEPPPGLARVVPGDGACDRAPDPYPYRRGDGEAHWERVVPGLPEPTSDPVPEPTQPDSGASDRDRDRYSRSDRDRDERISNRERDRDRDRDDRRPERDDRRSGRDRRDRDRDRDRDRRDRDESPDARRKRRSQRSRRYETEDTDYYSDKERDRRRHREGSYASRPPRAEREEARRYEERESRARRYPPPAPVERHERSYRDIDPARKHGNRRRERDAQRPRVTFSRDARSVRRDSSKSAGDTYSSPSRAESRENTATDEEPERRRERRHRHSARRTVDPYYDGYGGGAYGDPYLAQRQQYEYYERLRATDPAAYMQLYRRLMQPASELDGYAGVSAYGAREERGSVHSGRSSAHGLKGNDTYYMFRQDSLRDAASIRADLSDRDLNTEVSLPTNLETSTVRSERMTPHRFSTAHVKGSISSRHIVVVREAWPVDGRPATVQLVSLRHATARDPAAAELHACPTPLVRGVTHKKSVIEYCLVRVRSAAREGGADPLGYALLWDLLALLLTQNGVVVGSDIAELLMKNTREHEYKASTSKPMHDGSRRESSVSGSAEERSSPDLSHSQPSGTYGSNELSSPVVDEKAALDKLRELLLYGNRQEALEWAMSSNQWGHALHLAAYSERRTRLGVAARFLAAVPRTDPLHTLYAALAHHHPPSLEEAGDWRPHVAIILANSGARPDHDTRALTAFGDRLAARGLIYCAQFCYVAGGVPFSRHPLAPLSPPPAPATPPRLSLLLANPSARNMSALATTRAIVATEIYEYALSLHQHYLIPELQVYKFVMACRLVDCGEYERALAYVEQAARAVTRAPRDYSPTLVANLADMADRLKYHDPALHDDPPLLDEQAESEGSPRHQQWLTDVQNVAHMYQAESVAARAAPVEDYSQQPLQYSWDQAHQYQQQQQQQQVIQPSIEQQLYQPLPTEQEESPDYAPQYYQPPAPPADAGEAEPAPEWQGEQQTYDSTYWHGDNTYGYGEPSMIAAPGAEESNPRPMITMPATRAPPSNSYDEDEPHGNDQQQAGRETDTPKSSRKDTKPKDSAGGKAEGGKGGWLGGILTKLSLRPPNQMILPDDKNPSIVWDAEHKRWKNLDGEDAGAEQPPPPPPRMADITQHMMAQNTSTPNQSPAAPGAPPGAGAPPAAPVSNIFKMQKGRHIKKSYVDVFNPSGAATRALPPAASVLGPAPNLPANPTYFVPSADPAQGAYEPENHNSGI